MKIFIGADHRGYRLKGEIKALLEKQGHSVVDVGTHDGENNCDYPRMSFEVARHVVRSRNARGILVCMTGIGHSIAANKIPGVYAALCYNKTAAVLSRQHNNSNILILGARFVTKRQIRDIVKAWLNTDFEGGRHLRRFIQIKKIEKEITGKKR